MKQALVTVGMAFAILAVLVGLVVLVAARPDRPATFTAAELADWRARHCPLPQYAARYECTSTRDWR